MMLTLGVNIDHVATVREARKTNEPNPVWGAMAAELGGADGITFHLREDRRHIQDRDVEILKQTVTLPLNFELACCDEIVDFACKIQPYQATLVPERREEITTEGGLDVASGKVNVATAIQKLHDAGIVVSLFLDPNLDQIDLAKELGADAVELHTGTYALAAGTWNSTDALNLLEKAGAHVVQLGMKLHSGHGLNYKNVQPIAAIPSMRELNIGHSIVSRALMVGMEQAVREMKRLILDSFR